MDNDYLWDRTGEPDTEVQELEEVLSTLRYQPRPLELPAEVQPALRSRFYSTLAIAATIALMVLAAGVWLRFHRQQTSNPIDIVKTKSAGSGQESHGEASGVPPKTGRSDE